MKTRSLIISVFILLASCKSTSQSLNTDQAIDTIKLEQLKFKKVVAYQIGNATILTDYDNFMKSFRPFWKKYKKGIKSLDKGKVKAKEESPWYFRRFDFLDTTYKRLTSQIQTQDTVFINDVLFKIADIGTSFDFVRNIEEGKCIVLDSKNIIQPFILRQKHSYQKGLLDGWGGRLYFIDGQQKPFIRGTDWIS